MQVSIETTSGLERRLTVGVPADTIEQEINERLNKAAKTIRLDGFRQGKVPLRVVRQRYGAGVRQEVVGETMSRSFYEAITQESVRPAGQPKIEPTKDEPGQDLEFVATFEIYPEIELADFSKVSVAKPVAQVTDANLDTMIENLREQRVSWNTVERAAAMDDQVLFDYVGRKDGEAFEGGSAEGSNLVLGSGQMIPGFEDALVGMSAGDEKTAKLTFPDDYSKEDLQGAAVEFELKVSEVQQRHLPELDDEFFTQFGVKDGGEPAFRDEVRKNMTRELNTAIKTKFKGRVLEQLIELHEVELPSALVAGEVAALREQMVSQFGGGREFDPSLLPDELFSEQAERRVALGLIVAETVKVAEIKVDDDSVRAQIDEIAATYDQPEQVVSYYYSNEQMLNTVQSSVLEDQVIEHIAAVASVKEEEQSYEDAVKPDAKPGDEPGDTEGADAG
ncbi:MAG: trigger factor [Porticoccaceae bacterium]